MPRPDHRAAYSYDDLKRLIDPRSVAIVGLSRNERSFGARTAKNLEYFKGKTFGVNPKADSLCGIPCFGSISALPETVDCAVLAVPVEAVEALVERVQRQWGAALLIDLHSMPPLPTNGGPAAQFVIGDRFGTACDGELVASLFSHLAGARRLVAHNRPYAGGFVLDRHARRSSGIHAVQIEIDRTAYLDSAMAEPGPGFDSVVALLVAMVRQLADDVAALGRDRLRWRAAAE